MGCNRNNIGMIGMAVALAVALLGSTGGPADAITADLAKKCRELAIKAYPPQPAGTRPYAGAERAVFRDCVAHGGNAESAH